MNMIKLRLGIIGCGVMGLRHMEAAEELPWLKITAVADLNEQAAYAAAERFNVGHIFTAPQQLLLSGTVDAVVLAVPTAGRAQLARFAFEQGIHVLLEKPAAMSVTELEQLIVSKGDLVAACCSSRFRFLSHAEAAAAYIQSGAIGDIRHVRCRAVRPAGIPPEQAPPAWRLSKPLNGGGILSNWGSYDLDYVLGLTGWTLEPEIVLARTWAIDSDMVHYAAPGSDAESHGVLFVACANGSALTLERGEYTSAPADESWQIIGTKSTLTLKMFQPHDNKQIVLTEMLGGQGMISRIWWEGEEEHNDVHRGPVHDFAAAIVERRAPKTTLEQALVIQRILDAAYASSEQNTAIAIHTGQTL